MTDPIVEPARLEELRDVLSQIPGADRLPWTLEIYDRDDDGQDVLSHVLDIRTGRRLPKKQKG